MASRSGSRLLATVARAINGRAASPFAPSLAAAPALGAASALRGHATNAPAEDDAVKAAFIRQQATFRSYLEGLKKVPIPVTVDSQAVKAYADAAKGIRQSLGVPSWSEKLASLLESAEEDARDVRSFLEESRIIRRQLGIEDAAGAEAAMFAALDRVEGQLGGKALVADDAKGMALLADEINAINSKLGLKDSDLEKLEEQLEAEMALQEVKAFASEAAGNIDMYKKRDGLDDVDVDLKTLDPKAYL